MMLLLLLKPHFLLSLSCLKKAKTDLLRGLGARLRGAALLYCPERFFGKTMDSYTIHRQLCQMEECSKSILRKLLIARINTLLIPRDLFISLGITKGGADWNGINVGVEICRDHGMGRLKRWIENFGMRKPVDLHVVLSRGIYYHPPHDMSGEQGSFVLCDGVNGSSDVRRNSRLLQGEHTFFGTR